MSLKAGIVGLPNVGKSTLFNAITKKNVLAANYPFATIEPNVGVVPVPDKRLEDIRSIYSSIDIIPTSFEFIDIAGLVAGASKGEGLGNKFLSHIRTVDAIVQVVRCFDDKTITHVSGEVNPVSDVEIINVELILADLEIIENRLDKIIKKAQTTKDILLNLEKDILIRCKDQLMKNLPLRKLDLTKEEQELIKNYNFITLKPIIYVANVDEDSIIIGDNSHSKSLKEYASLDGSGVIVTSVKLEEQMASLTDDEKISFFKEVGITSSGLDKLIFASYELLGLQTFFTAGEKETRAWTFKKGMKAPECAGIIHSDLERGFIRAEVMSFDDLKTYGSEKSTQEAGKLRLEGKEYIMQDGDVCYFRFNV